MIIESIKRISTKGAEKNLFADVFRVMENSTYAIRTHSQRALYNVPGPAGLVPGDTVQIVDTGRGFRLISVKIGNPINNYVVEVEV